MEFEDQSKNGKKKQYTVQEILAEMFGRFDLITETQIRLNTMLQGWYVKLDVYSRAIHKLATKLGLSDEEFKTLVDSCLNDLNEEQEKFRVEAEQKLAEEVSKNQELLITDTSLN